MILDVNGKKPDDRCPRCKADKDRRENAAGFGPPVIICGNCGYPYKEGE